MKKLLVVALLTITLTTSASASTVSLSDYSNEEIVTLYEQIRQEMVDRGVEKTASLTSGEYEIGVDIPVGRYMLNMSDGNHQSFTIYEDGEPVDIFIAYNGKQVQQHIEFAEGQMIKVNNDGSCTLTISHGVVFE